MPVPASRKAKTFEEMLEEEIARGTGGIVAESSSPSRQKQTGTA